MRAEVIRTAMANSDVHAAIAGSACGSFAFIPATHTPPSTNSLPTHHDAAHPAVTSVPHYPPRHPLFPHHTPSPSSSSSQGTGG